MMRYGSLSRVTSLPSVVAGTACIALTYAFTRELVGRSAGLAASGIVAFAAPLIELSRVARNYTIPLAVFILVAFLQARGLRRRSEGFSKCRRNLISRNTPSRCNFFFNARSA